MEGDLPAVIRPGGEGIAAAVGDIVGPRIIAIRDPDALFAIPARAVDDLIAVRRPVALLAGDLDVKLPVVGGAQEVNASVRPARSSNRSLALFVNV